MSTLAMAVCTDNLTLPNFCLDRRPTIPGCEKLRNPLPLGAGDMMVKLENTYVTLAAVCAGALAQVMKKGNLVLVDGSALTVLHHGAVFGEIALIVGL